VKYGTESILPAPPPAARKIGAAPRAAGSRQAGGSGCNGSPGKVLEIDAGVPENFSGRDRHREGNGRSLVQLRQLRGG